MATACSFLDSPFKRATAWALGYAVSRLMLSAFSPVPFILPLDPLALCLAGVLSSAERKQLPGFLLILAAGQVAGDLATGMAAASWSLRLAGLLLLTWALPREKDSLSTALTFAVTHAVYSALAPEFRGEFPFAYIYAVTLFQSLLWIGLMTPLLPNDLFRPGPAFLQILGLPAAVLALWMLLTPSPLWPPPALGASAGTWTRVAAVLLLLPPLLPRLLPFLGKRPPAPPSSSQPARWRDLVQ